MYTQRERERKRERERERERGEENVSNNKEFFWIYLLKLKIINFHLRRKIPSKMF